MAGEWREVLLGDVAADVTVGHVGPMASEYVEIGVPFLRSQNVEPLRINNTDLKFITGEFHRRLKKSALSPGDVVIVRTGKPGACAVIPQTLPVANCSDLVVVRCGLELDPRFVAYYVNSVAVHHVNSHLVGAVQQHFNVGSARTMVMRLPDLPEQRAIAHILGTLDDKIELNRRMNETLEAMARALFKSWFVDFDPVRAKVEGRGPGLRKPLADLFPAGFVDSELGEIPEGWHSGRVGDLCDAIYSGGTPSTQSLEYWNGVVPWLSSGETREKFIIDTERRITPAGVSNSSTRLAPALSTVIASAGQGTPAAKHRCSPSSATSISPLSCLPRINEQAPPIISSLTSNGATKSSGEFQTPTVRVVA
jgi:type I restriction enzyme S subunit